VFLSSTEANEIEARVARVEARTGAQVVTAIVPRSDAYRELPWMAFALGAALAGLAATVAAVWRPVLVIVMMILGVGIASALLVVFVPAFARLFLTSARRELEVRHHARLIFLARELFATRGRGGILILVSRFERRVEIVADVGLRERVTESDWQTVIARMAPTLAASRFPAALLDGLAAVEELLLARGFQGPPPSGNELSDRPIDEAPTR
jgi:putative membrane protein